MRVTVRGAAVSFGARHVFENFSAGFESCKVTALVGPSGSGKSTLLAAIAGYQRLDAGAILLDTADTHPDPALVAWVPQSLNALGARTVLDNVMIASFARGATIALALPEAVRCLAEVGLAGRARSPARELSGGELQRLALARALASGKPIILADEPSANLDPGNARAVAAVLRQLSGRATIIVATHDPVLMSGADAVVEMISACR